MKGEHNMSQRVIKIRYNNGKEDMIDIGDRTSIDEYWFYDYRDLEDVSVHDIVSIEFPVGITALNMCACYSFGNLESVVLPDGIEIIGESAFDGCTKLTSVNCPNTVNTIGRYAFCDTSITEFLISRNIKKVGEGAFSGCDIERFDFPNTDIEVNTNGLFSHCTCLTHVSLPDCITEIMEDCFSCCKMLEDVNMPKNLKSIEDWAFQGCRKIKFKPEDLSGLDYVSDYAFC